MNTKSPCSFYSLVSLVFFLALCCGRVLKVEEEVVEADEGGEEIGEDAHGVRFSEGEVAQQRDGAEDGHDPEDAGHLDLLRLLGGEQLRKPAPREHEDPEVADDLPRVENDGAPKEGPLEEGGVHEAVAVGQIDGGLGNEVGEEVEHAAIQHGMRGL